MTPKGTGQPIQKAGGIGLFSLALINIVAIASLRDLPQMAEYGLGAVFFYSFAALFFFVPVSLVAAELASAWPERGGVYVWVREAFGDLAAFVAIFIQWFQNLCWYPVVLTFAAASLAFAVAPADNAMMLAQDKGFIVSVVLVIYWASTLLNLLGLRWSARISAMGAFSGVLIPGAVLLALAALSLLQGRPSHLDLDPGTLIPDLSHLGALTFGVSVLLAFAGMEMSAAHAREVRHPARTYPLAIGIAAVAILSIFVLGSLSIAVALPAGAFDLQTGVTQAIDSMLRPLGLEPLTRVVALMMALGVIGSVNSWIVGPSKGLLVAGERGELPALLLRCNRHGVPVRILLLQGVIVSFLCLSFSLQPSVASAYFMLSDLTIQLYLAMYLLLFLAALKLRRDRPEVPRPFRIPALWLVCGLGIVGAMVAIVVGFFPPTQFGARQIDPPLFVGFLLIGMSSVIAFPTLLHGAMRRAAKAP